MRNLILMAEEGMGRHLVLKVWVFAGAFALHCGAAYAQVVISPVGGMGTEPASLCAGQSGDVFSANNGDCTTNGVGVRSITVGTSPSTISLTSTAIGTATLLVGTGTHQSIFSGSTGSATIGGNLSVTNGNSINFNGNVVSGVGTPVNPSDAANKAYVDSVANGGNKTFTSLSVTGTSSFGSTGQTQIDSNGNVTLTNGFGDKVSMTSDVGNGFGGFKATSGTDSRSATLSAPGLTLNNGTVNTVVLDTQTGNGTFSGNVNVGGGLTVTGQTITHDLLVDGGTTGVTTINGATTNISTTTINLGNSAVTTQINVNAPLEVHSTADFHAPATFDDTATFNNGATIHNGLTVTGGANIDSLAVTNGASIGGNLGVSGNSTIGGTLGVTGLTSLNGGVNVTGNSSFDGVATFTHTAVPGQGTTQVDGGLVTLTNGSAPAEKIILNANADPVFTVTNGTAAGTTTITNGVVVAGTSVNAPTVNANTVNTANANIGTSLSVASGANIDMGGNVVHDVATPVVGTDAANKAYVDAGLSAANRRITKAYEGTALALSLEQPVFLPGQTFAMRGGWGNFEGENAFGVSAAGLIAHDVFGFGSTVTVDAGVGVSTDTNQVAGKAGVTIGFGGVPYALK